MDRLAALHTQLDALHQERAALISYVARLHGGDVTSERTGWSLVHVHTAAGRLSWRVAPDDWHLFAGLGDRPAPAPADKLPHLRTAETNTRLSFLHLHRRPNMAAAKRG
ncbi:hypothetical protein [Streptomyces sp. CBMA152]|uniref:hypothetical protein n=1 Tax=Streptomyces sp. CBMA152 TaxID=1896312 RepID=UPI001661347D|nr:hypothetical protein [Streptomyces sp. CBMA152]MBD0744964.1 hypothetical protein [Streptomyces sp. CBMA152]